ncbi:hypothetical protein B0J12DRAFT_290914 [Macrophomina phaseolina]|uniref:Secreted protein n=1 Tax=Macrophomina phaseolina TaxID=35725 RepID=A0ABQ8GNK4_9PEZI|nr:hypothetical protein B0J12DRAFT_290914 [Macrophomina phaseolina]
MLIEQYFFLCIYLQWSNRGAMSSSHGFLIVLLSLFSSRADETVEDECGSYLSSLGSMISHRYLFYYQILDSFSAKS